MPNRRLSLRKVKEILRLKLQCGISEREISRNCRVSRSTVSDYLRRAAAAKLRWTEVSLLPENQIEERLFPTEHIPSSVKRQAPDCKYIYTQLRTFQKFNLTLSQRWIEYKDKQPDGYQYTQFCEYYCRWCKKLDYCMRQEHRDGEKLFIDYADGLSIVDAATDLWLIKIDNNGNKVWDKTFGGSGSDEGYAIVQSADDGFVIIGYTASYGAGSNDVWLVKRDSNSDKPWDKTFGGANYDAARSIVQLNDGKWVITKIT